MPDSLDVVELMMAVEKAVDQDPNLTAAERQRLLREIELRIERGEFGGLDDLDSGALGIAVRALGPKGPPGEAGATAEPDSEPEAPGQSGYAN